MSRQSLVSWSSTVTGSDRPPGILSLANIGAMSRGGVWATSATCGPRSDASCKTSCGGGAGQSNDPTAISVIHHTVRPLDEWDVNGNTAKQKVEERFDVRHVERAPLGTPYPEIVAHVGHLMARPELSRPRPTLPDARPPKVDLVIDETGVGRAVGDIFDAAGMTPIRVTITAGGEATDQGQRRWHVAKGILISTLDARLHTGELRFASDLTDAHALAEELKDFRRKVSAAGRYSYEARVGKHDDLVLSVAIGVWWAARPAQYTMSRGPELKGFYGGG
jgi:hypothetical protein